MSGRPRLSAGDLLRVGGSGLRARPARMVLSALGIAIGIAAMVAVVGISASSRASLQEQLGRLGTNLLSLAPGNSLFGGEAVLPPNAGPKLRRVAGVHQVASVGALKDLSVYRSDKIPKGESGGITAYTTDLVLLTTLKADLAAGAWLNAATARYPTVVLGSTTARRLGITRPGPHVQVLIGDVHHTVTGVLAPIALAPELDAAAFVGIGNARTRLRFDGHPTTAYVRADEQRLAQIRELLAPTLNPENPNEVKVLRPSDALTAKQAADQAFTGLLLGLGAVALLVGGVGVANTMIISVLERRGEIGLRRALGATRGQIRSQFLVEAIVLSALGGVAGAALGCMVTAGYALSQGWQTALPLPAIAAGVAATVAMGVIAGLWPAVRAARLAPTQALSIT
ncbi:ABC transporter permease [Nonomuraea sp. NBC_01738]|uniref:ABC transporter permease n=1 Tax=Nonomuraea sp. NBC_01738 TaxID=2976003 RepID=UPI002E0ED79A|nr:ABC transporter permease [Nonomuraea sp. NBC_01738]